MQEIETGDFAPRRWVLWPPSSIRVVDWNIDRGLQLQGIIEFLAKAEADVIFLQEADVNARRTHHLNIAKEIAQNLQMNYIFGLEFQELTQGSRQSPAYHGQATLSRWPLSNPRLIRFRRQSNFWRPHWFLPRMEPFQERIGGRIALVSDVSIGNRTLVTYNLHLESRGESDLRRSQLDEVLDDSRRYTSDLPRVVAGDMNFDISADGAAEAIGRAQFRNPFAEGTRRTTVPRSLFHRGHAIDWILARGPVHASQPKIHSYVSASDHYPVSVTLTFE